MQMRTAGVSIGLAPTSGRLAALRVGCHAGSITLRHRRLGACAVWTAAGGSRFPVNICHPAVTSRPGRHNEIANAQITRVCAPSQTTASHSNHPPTPILQLGGYWQVVGPGVSPPV